MGLEETKRVVRFGSASCAVATPTSAASVEILSQPRVGAKLVSLLEESVWEARTWLPRLIQPCAAPPECAQILTGGIHDSDPDFIEWVEEQRSKATPPAE